MASCGGAVGDPSDLNRALERYEDIDYTFSGSREGKLLRVCLPALRQLLCGSTSNAYACISGQVQEGYKRGLGWEFKTARLVGYKAEPLVEQPSDRL